MIRVLLKDLDAKMIKISEVMSSPPPLYTIDSGESLTTAREMLRAKPVRHLTITRNAEVVGVLSIKDL
jgi:signal-transduction protein with cAMP-binding, CBS, and nucleotidyltransferase domain